MSGSKLSVDAANAFLEKAFAGSEGRSKVVLMQEGRAVVRLDVGETHLRPGGYVSGPTQMAMVDTAVYMAVMTRIGLEPMTVTTSLNMTFLRPCIGRVVEAEARLLKLGRTLAVAEADVRVAGADKASSHALATYAVPRRDERS